MTRVTVKHAQSNLDKRKYLTYESGNRYPVIDTWLIYEDGERTEFVIVEAAYGKVFGYPTEGDDTVPLSAWHVGIKAGPLARASLHLAKERAKEVLYDDAWTR